MPALEKERTEGKIPKCAMAVRAVGREWALGPGHLPPVGALSKPLGVHEPQSSHLEAGTGLLLLGAPADEMR